MKDFVEKNNHKAFLLALIIGVLFAGYGLFLNTTYNCDLLQNFHYATAQKYTFKEYFIRRMSGGRGVAIIPYAFYRLLAVMQIHYFSHQWVLQGIALLFLSVAAYMCMNLYKGYCSEDLRPIEFLTLMLCFVSPAFVEVLCFCGIEQPLAYLFTIVALNEYLRNHKVRSLIMLLLAISLYQNYVLVFLILGITICYLGKEKGAGFVKYAGMFVVAGLTSITNIVATKVFCKVYGITEIKAVNTDFRIGSIISKTQLIFMDYKEALSTGYGYYKPGYVIISALILLVLSTAILWYRKKLDKALSNILISGLALLLPPTFMFAMESPYYPLRVQVPLYVSLSMIIMIQLSVILNSTYTVAKMFSYAIVGLFFVITVIRVQTGIADILIMNKLEFYEVRQIVDEIADYERTTGNQIEKVKIRKEDNGTGKYDDLYLNIKGGNRTVSQHILGTPWSDAELLSFILGREIEREDMSESEFSAYFDDFDIEKMGKMKLDKLIHIEEDVLYWITV
ncbi:MAG: glucosyltransferase domain-containing protein [Lachnospiraceae bacterium]|nr:glucosyltransferase domain-containing protein [Lachnospiraceae bacterium]